MLINRHVAVAATGGLRVLGIVTALLTNLHQQIVVIRFLNPKLHVRLVLEKWAWHIKTLPGNLLQLYNHESE